MSRRTNQVGSVAAYIIVGILLVAALVEGVYLVRWRSGQVAKQPTNSEQSQPDKKTTEPEKKKESTPKSEVSTNKPADNSVSTGSNNVQMSPVLPVTGIEKSATSYLGLFVLTFAGSSYLVSRKRNYHKL